MKRSIVYLPLNCLPPLLAAPVIGTTCVSRAGPCCALAMPVPPTSINPHVIVAAVTAIRSLDIVVPPRRSSCCQGASRFAEVLKTRGDDSGPRRHGVLTPATAAGG